MTRPQILSASDFRWPNNTHRASVVGRTGSGKTRFAAFMLSAAPFDRQPYVVIYYKCEELFRQIDRAREIDLRETPKHPGIYVLRPLPHEEEAVDAWLWKIWERQRVGLYIDEMYLLPANSNALRAILTTGRSRRIPMIMCTQRPTHVPRHVFTEADFHSVFHLNDMDDVKTVKRFFHSDIDLTERLDQYHSYWYDVGRDAAFVMRPVPSDDEILERLHERLKPARIAI